MSPHGIAKVFGTLLSLAGVMTMTLYRGPAVQSFPGASVHIRSDSVHKNWTKGSILIVASCISWSIWFIMQVFTMIISLDVLVFLSTYPLLTLSKTMHALSTPETF